MKISHFPLLALLPVLMGVLSFANNSHAEDFTMTRGYDGKVFYCTEQPGGGTPFPVPVVSVSICDCAYYNNSYGEVVAQSSALSTLRTSCAALNSSAVIANCRTAPAPQGSVSCDCQYYNNSYGQVLAGANELGELAKACHRSNSSAFITNCKVH